MWDAGFIAGDNDSGVVNLLDCVKNEAMNVGGLNYGILLFGVNFKCITGVKSIMIDSFDDLVGDTPIFKSDF